VILPVVFTFFFPFSPPPSAAHFLPSPPQTAQTDILPSGQFPFFFPGGTVPVIFLYYVRRTYRAALRSGFFFLKATLPSTRPFIVLSPFFLSSLASRTKAGDALGAFFSFFGTGGKR